jgi:predicted  nucleic acid-binding Zn-ribbon protein
MRHRSPGGLTLGAVKASPQSQLRLLVLADLDAELGRLDHRRRSLPEVAELGRLEARASELKDEIVVTETELGDLSREENRAERDVEQVRSRIDRDRARLDAGQVSAARELATLQSEIESLRRRQGDLEEIVLELMERREGLVSRRDELAAERDSLGTETAEVAARRDAAFKEIDEQAGKAAEQRGTVVTDVPADLLKLYEQIRDTRGVGAAALRAGRCQGCHLNLNTVDLNQIRGSAPDEVLRCEECRRILVRTPESGL